MLVHRIPMVFIDGKAVNVWRQSLFSLASGMVCKHTRLERTRGLKGLKSGCHAARALRP
jgi:hypothetical protein